VKEILTQANGKVNESILKNWLVRFSGFLQPELLILL
jgi:hypothetical protein